MQARHRDLSGVEALGQLEARGDLRELALAVRARAAVATLEHGVVEVHRRLGERGDVDDARWCGAPQEGKQAEREQEAGEMVDREAQLVAVAALLAGRAVGSAGADAGVVDQDMELGRLGLDVRGGERTSSSEARSA